MSEPIPDLLRDPLDFAAALSEAERSHNTARIQLLVAPKQVRKEDGTWPHTECSDCGEPIGEKRLEVTGALDCFECATFKEQKGKQYAKR